MVPSKLVDLKGLFLKAWGINRINWLQKWTYKQTCPSAHGSPQECHASLCFLEETHSLFIVFVHHYCSCVTICYNKRKKNIRQLPLWRLIVPWTTHLFKVSKFTLGVRTSLWPSRQEVTRPIFRSTTPASVRMDTSLKPWKGLIGDEGRSIVKFYMIFCVGAVSFCISCWSCLLSVTSGNPWWLDDPSSPPIRRCRFALLQWRARRPQASEMHFETLVTGVDADQTSAKATWIIYVYI